MQYSLTLVEGWNFRQVRAALAKQPKLDQTLAGLSDSELMAKIGHPTCFLKAVSFRTLTATCAA